VLIALVMQWARQDRRTSARSDRYEDAGSDDDMDAYEGTLRELSRQRITST
jgi:putative copper resistance protein D